MCITCNNLHVILSRLARFMADCVQKWLILASFSGTIILKVQDDRQCDKQASPMSLGWRGGWHKALVSDCLPLAAPIGLSQLLILTLCSSERVLAV